MSGSYHPSRCLFSSDNRVSGPNLADFTCQLNSAVVAAKHMSIESVSIPMLFYGLGNVNQCGSQSCELYWQLWDTISGVDLSNVILRTTVTSSVNYNLTTLATALNAAIVSNTATRRIDTNAGVQLTSSDLQFTAQTTNNVGKLSFSSSFGVRFPGTLDTNPVNHVAGYFNNTLAQRLGICVTTMQTGAGQWLFSSTDLPVYGVTWAFANVALRVENFQLTASFAGGDIATDAPNGGSQVVARIPVGPDVLFGSVVSYTNPFLPFGEDTGSLPPTFQTVRFQLLDEDGNPLLDAPATGTGTTLVSVALGY